uniref:Secreted protein n=1 Tax=Anopheles darlingi TaxID=43151 RepID=A0A2M4DK78_ANODA
MMLLLMAMGSILFLPPMESEIERGIGMDRETMREKERERERKREMGSISNRALLDWWIVLVVPVGATLPTGVALDW